MPRYPARKSIRLKGYPYDRAGAYFVTISTHKRQRLFGEIRDGKMLLNDAGKEVEYWYFELENKYPTIWCGPEVIMPDHFHAILIIHDERLPKPIAVPTWAVEAYYVGPKPSTGKVVTEDNTFLSDAIRWFKTMTTNAFIKGVKTENWPRFDGKVWHRGYYEKIIRSERAFNAITDYIVLNPYRRDGSPPPK